LRWVGPGVYRQAAIGQGHSQAHGGNWGKGGYFLLIGLIDRGVAVEQDEAAGKAKGSGLFD
jgi:hypothetical protein